MIAAHRPDHIGRERGQGHVTAALAQLQGASSGVGHDGEPDTLNVGEALRVPVSRIALEDDFAVRLQAHETKRAGADRLLTEAGGAAIGNDTESAIGKIPQQACKGLFEMEDDGEIIGRINALHILISRGTRAADGAVEHGINRPLHVARGQRAAVVEADARAQMKNVGQRIGNLPACRHAGLQIEMLIATDKRIEDEHVNAFRPGIGANAWIEIRRSGLDDHHQRVGVGLARTCGEEQKGAKGKAQALHK